MTRNDCLILLAVMWRVCSLAVTIIYSLFAASTRADKVENAQTSVQRDSTVSHLSVMQWL